MFSSNTKEAANNLKGDVKDALGNAKRIEKALESDGNHEITKLANNAGRKVRGYFDAANDSMSHTTEMVNEEIHTHPLRSTLIALGAGFIIGALMRR